MPSFASFASFAVRTSSVVVLTLLCQLSALPRRALAPPEEVRPTVERLHEEGTVIVAVGERFVHRDVVNAAAGRLREALDAFHSANPRRAGIAPADLVETVGVPAAVFELALDRLVAEGAAVRAGEVVALAGRGPRHSPQDEALSGRVELVLREGGLAPSGPAEIAEALGAPPEHVAAMIRLLADEGHVVPLNEKVVMHREAVEAAQRAVLDLFARKAVDCPGQRDIIADRTRQDNRSRP